MMIHNLKMLFVPPATKTTTCEHTILSMIRKDERDDETLPLIETYQPIYSDSDSSQSQIVGITLMLVSALFFCTMTVLVRYILAYQGISVATMVLLRGTTQSSLAFVSVSMFGKVKEVFRVPRRLLPLLILRGILGSVSLSLYYMSLTRLNLGMTTSIFFINPIFTLIVSRIFLNEQFGRVEAIAAISSILGVFLIANPTLDLGDVHDPQYIFGVLFGLLSAGFVAFTLVTIRAIGSQIHFMNNVVALGTGVMILGIAMGGTYNVTRESPKGLLLAVLACFSGYIGQCLFNFSLQLIKAGTGSVLRTIDVPLAYTLGVLFLGEVPHVVSLIGAGMVVSSCAAIGLNAKR